MEKGDTQDRLNQSGAPPDSSESAARAQGAGGVLRDPADAHDSGLAFARMVETLGPHDHVAFLFETPEERRAVVSAFVASGLARGEKCICVADNVAAEDIRQQLTEDGVDVAAALLSGRIVVLSEAYLYMQNGVFDSARSIALLIEEADRAVREGYSALRVTGGMTWAVHGAPATEQILEYEAQLGRDFFPHYPCLGMCQYDRWNVDPEVVKGVIMTHPLLIHGGRLYHNFYYVPPEEFLTPSRAAREAQHWLNNLEREQRQRDTLRQSEERYVDLFEQSQEAIAIVEPSGRILEANQAWLQLYGYARDELRELNVLDLYVNPSERTDFLKRIDATDFLRDEVRYRRKDGSIVECRRSVAAQRNERGDIVAFLSLVQDVTEQKRALQALRDSEEKYRSLFEQSVDAISFVSPEGKILEVNRSWFAAFGYEADELKNLTASDVYADPAERKDLLRVMAEQGHLEDEVRFKRKDGTLFDCERRVTARRAPNGAVIGFQAVFHDITEQKRAERALRESESKYRALFEQSLDAIWSLNPDGTGNEVNRAWLNLFGYQPEDIPTLNAADVYVNPADRDDFMRRMAATGAVSDEVRFKRKDGTVFDAERRVVALKDSQGKVIRFQGVSRDVTERKKAEMALRESEEKYRTLFEQSMDAISLVAEDGTLLDANPAYWRLFGWDPRDLGRINVRSHYEDPAERDSYLRRMKEQGMVIDDEHRLVKSDGTVMDCLRSSVARRDETGRIVAYQTVIHDITRRKQTESALRTSQDRLNLAIENAPIVLFDQDRGLRYTWLHNTNPTLGMDHALGKTDEDLFPPEEADVLTEIKRRVLETGNPSRDVVQTTVGGRTLSYDLTVKPVLDESGGVAGITCAAVDITERTRAQQQLKAGHDRLEQVLQGTLEVIQQMTEARDPYTSGHQRRVSALAEAIARKMGLPEESCVAVIRTAALIHDIGKINVPAEILSKPTPLTDAEFNVVKAHPQIGYDILKKAMLPDPVAEVVLQHHERLDGSGYPQHLTADNILPEAQILAVADTVEAMSSHRPYRPALGIDAALQVVSGGSGTTYDVDVVAACLAVFRDDGFTW